jgi:hypothetical protein
MQVPTEMGSRRLHVSRLENLPPDLQAVLSLLVGRGKDYAEIAALLSIEERAVHDRAHAALALLAPRQAREPSASQREQVGEYLLGQADPAQRSAARACMESSAPAEAWARALAAELAPIATTPLPEIPAGVPTGEREPLPPAARAPTSRRGGAIVLGGIAAIAIVAVALIVGLGGGSHTGSATTPTAPGASTATTPIAPGATTGSTTASTPSTATSKAPTTSGKTAGEPHLDATLPLTSPDPSSKAVGIIEVVSQGHQYAFLVAAEHLPPTSGFRYAAWLYNSQTDAFLLGRGPTVGANGLLKAAGGLPANAAHYSTIVLTEERSVQPSKPGPIVLSGAFKLS